MAQKEVPLLLAAIALVSGGLLVIQLARHPLANLIFNPAPLITSLGNNLTTQLLTTPKPTPSPRITPLWPDIQEEPATTPTQAPNPTITPKPTSRPVVNRPATTPVPQQPCYRFTVPHLDGSSSTLCYSLSDYNQLQSLSQTYYSAKSNYEYELRVQKMYEEAQKDSFNPGFYQESIDKAKQQAQHYKDQMGQIALEMYNIEKRGY